MAIGVLFVLSLVAPAAALASTPITLTLVASSTSQFTDVPLTFTATATPAVAGIQLRLDDSNSPLVQGFGTTDSDGVATIVLPAPLTQAGPRFFTVSSTDDGTNAAATSNTVEVDLNRHAVPITLAAESDRSSPIITYLDPMSLVADMPNSTGTCDGFMEIHQLPTGVDQAANRVGPWERNGVHVCEWYINLPVQPLGELTFQADYSHSYVNEDASTGPVTFNVTLIPTTTVVEAGPAEAEAGTTVDISAVVSAPVHGDLVYGTGSVTFFDGSALIATVPLESEGSYGVASLFETLDTLGTHEISAVYSGTDIALSSSGAPVDISVVTDLAHAVDLGPNYATFYPVVDGFVDTVSLRGELDEPESVAITITNSHGTVVRRLAVPMRDVGDYSVAWNGRTTSGSTVPAGAYRITTVVTDALGAHVTFTDKVTVSLKKLVWYSVTKTVAGDRFTARGGSAGKVTASPVYAGGARMTLPFIMGPEFYALGYQFTLPTATRYSGLSFSVLGSGSVVDIGLQDKRLGNWPSGSRWIIDYFSPLKEVPTRYAWTAIGGNLTYNVLGHTVRGVVLDTSYGHYDVREVRLKYRYALLK